MMNDVDLHSWEEFVERLGQLELKRKQQKKNSHLHVSNYLFRGQSNASWELETTLDRLSRKQLNGKQWHLIDYYRILLLSRPRVEAFTGSKWDDIPDCDKYEYEVNKLGSLTPINFPAFEYLSFLRHHGFPSPLLDWTQSPYVAAYFAFRDLLSDAEKVSIYAYCELKGRGKVSSSSAAKISSFGHYIRSHPRHFHQQSEYTVCTIYADNIQTYAPHEDVFKQGIEGQDEIWKFNIPASERNRVLKLLDQYNINAFSLFGSEESLMEMLSIREILFHDG